MKSARNFREKADLVALWLRIFSLVLCLASLFVPFATALTSRASSDSGSVLTNYGPAFAFLFGGQIHTGRITYSAIGVSVIATIAYILVVCSFVSLLLSFFLKQRAISKWTRFGAALGTLAASILMMCSHTSAATVLADSILGKRSDSVVATMIRNTTLQFGFWGVALFGFVISTLLLASFIFDGTLDEIRLKRSNK